MTVFLKFCYKVNKQLRITIFSLSLHFSLFIVHYFVLSAPASMKIVHFSLFIICCTFAKKNLLWFQC